MRFKKFSRIYPLWGLLATLAVQAQEAAAPELSEEFLLYLLEFQDDQGNWVDPQALQLVLDAESVAQKSAKHSTSSDPDEEDKP